MLAAVLIGLLVVGPAWAISTFTVNHTTNESNASTADGVCDFDPSTAGNQCTLKAAIQQANANANPAETDLIRFNIPGDTTVTTNSNGTVSVNDFVATRTVPVGQSITATATKVVAPAIRRSSAENPGPSGRLRRSVH